MIPPIDLLKQLIDYSYPLPDKDWEIFSKIWTSFSAKRKEVLTHAGEKEKYLYFVVDGVQRVYYFDDQDREATLVFTYSPSFGGVLDALLLQQPSRYFYETLTPSVFLRASATDLLALTEQSRAIELLVRQGLVQALAGVLERLAELQCYSSEEKFRKLLQRSPHILQRVPHKYLANYLGIDPTNFSKLINKVKI
ncbi:Crp/Fnr family transcriptional regulator [Cytophagaceae bacterium DM2B3-1]|uniref:Crp/Fnr family transcriptional regulator n=1 Tax=Xanthocytophaga flava TaxID=3048013 RepID=A0ABT7CN69_9BACT|nr:Crp/Fnr family transcriptional regulator [Xanthocytophaga flavus]MDJ1469927.1 Crp/Fnr family transcriptional regulator [Xanthocytophaga flavus]MDJ1494437.1 Crp/Fnr family transcriptional regulator [Xanthocytophaga flavus]